MNRLDSLNEQRASVKLRYEAAWRVGDCEAEAMALCELEQIDKERRALMEKEVAR